MLTVTGTPELARPSPVPAANPTVPGLAAGLPPLMPGSAMAKALCQVWSGNPVTVVDSAPGAGKTQMVVDVAAHLVLGAHLSLVVATPTRNQAVSVAHRLARLIEPSLIRFAVSGIPVGSLPVGVKSMRPRVGDREAQVEIRTLKSCEMRPPDCDTMIVDEAYQATFASIAEASRSADQILAVGDPGQIGPVVTVDTSIWDGVRFAPHMRAPDAIKQRPDTSVLAMGASWRLGTPSLRAIAPLYDFELTSARPPRSAISPSGDRLPEIASVAVPATGDPDSPATMRTVAETAASLISTTLTGPGRSTDGEQVLLAWDAEPSDIAVALSRNTQVAAVTAMLAQAGLVTADRPEGSVTVGTADRLQGGEWPLVVAVDPTIGGTDDDHALNLGRLAVMLSRHTTRMVWVHDDTWRTAIPPDGEDAERGRKVRQIVCGEGGIPR